MCFATWVCIHARTGSESIARSGGPRIDTNSRGKTETVRVTLVTWICVDTRATGSPSASCVGSVIDTSQSNITPTSVDRLGAGSIALTIEITIAGFKSARIDTRQTGCAKAVRVESVTWIRIGARTRGGAVAIISRTGVDTRFTNFTETVRLCLTAVVSIGAFTWASGAVTSCGCVCVHTRVSGGTKTVLVLLAAIVRALTLRCAIAGRGSAVGIDAGFVGWATATGGILATFVA